MNKLKEAIEYVNSNIQHKDNAEINIYIKSILKTAMPRAVEVSKEEWGTDVMCPTCGSYFTREECEEGVPYCKYCGQSLDWGMTPEEEADAYYDWQVRRGEEERENREK